MPSNEKVKFMSKKKKTDTQVDYSGYDVTPVTKYDSESMIDVDDSFKIADLYFKQKNVLYNHLYNSFNKFLDEDVKNLLTYGDNVFFEKLTKDKVIKYKFKYTNISIKPPTFDNDDELMFPADARTRNLTYAVKLVATVTQVQEIINVFTNEVTEKMIGVPEDDVPIATIPTMVRSKYCSLNIKKGYDKNECDYDPGGYFIVNGSEKAVMSLERMCDNKPLIFSKKDSNHVTYSVQVNSKAHRPNGMTQVIAIRMKKDNTMSIKVPILSEIPVFILIRALGIESDRDIVNYVVYDDKDTDMINLVRMSLDNTKNETRGSKIMTQDDAVDYLTSKMRILKKYTDTDQDVKQAQKRMHLLSLLQDNFLPHIEGRRIYKSYYLCYMINRLLNCVLGRVPIDDRDSYVNKRIDLPGNLIEELFKQHYKKMLNECNRIFKKRNNDDENPFNIISQIKPNIIEQGLKTALLTGAWSGKRKGVAQMLQRLTYLQTLSSLRRVNSPTVDASTNKLTSPRHLHPTQVPFLCYIETPEGIKVGLVKSLSLVGNITVMKSSQVYILKGMMIERIMNIADVPPSKLLHYTKVFLNGEWLGVTDKPQDLYMMMKKKKISGEIETTTSVVFDIERNNLNVYCDGGRMYRPMLRVKDNVVQLTKSHLDLVSITSTSNPTMSTSWNEFMMKHPGLIENIDMEEQTQVMAAMIPKDVDNMRNRMINSIETVKNMKKKDLEHVVNRYDDTMFVRYTHCEIHPALLMGVVASNIPFSNHNQGPRNIFQYSQARQAMGIYTSNYRDRLDISYVLYHPMKPLVTTRTIKYLNSDTLTSGENIIVAIACYTGYNQEDSVILNQGALDRGMFRSTSLKKYFATIQKNHSTSQNDQFMKPDPTKVKDMKPGSYEKLNDDGLAPEETYIVNGDIIIGKVSPIQPSGTNNKSFKDNSEVYKSHIPGCIDKVYSDIYNHEGYEMKKMRVRSERIPHIGDKFCSRHGQKGTVGITLPHADMPFTASGITPDLIMNPNAIPSRMTIGQFVECITGKIAAIRGQEIDGTPFNETDIEQIKKELEELGFEGGGTEVLYNGMTGKRMKVHIFMGPTYYMRLKHMVSDKMHSRSRGPRTLLTRQAPEGRSRDGGLRVGEMERDTILSHGMAKFLKERMLETADIYTTWVCDECGLFAQRMLKKEQTIYPNKKDIYWCPSCRNKTAVSKIMIPYAFKLLLQELMSMSIAPRIKVKKNKYSEV